MNTSGVGGPERASLLDLHKIIPSPPQASLPGKVLRTIRDIIVKLGKELINFMSQKLRGRPWFEYEGKKGYGQWLRGKIFASETDPFEYEAAFRQLEKRVLTLEKVDSDLARGFMKVAMNEEQTGNDFSQPLTHFSDMLETYENLVDLKAFEEDVSQVHMDNGKRFGSETIELIPTIEQLIQAKEAEQLHYEADPPKELDEEIKRLKDESNRQKTWITANDSRNYGKNHVVGLSEQSAEKRYIPGLINARKHRILGPDGKTEMMSVLRCGVIHYPSKKAKVVTEEDFAQHTPRARALEDQMLQLIRNQVEMHPPSENAKDFTLFQLSTLAPNKADTDQTKKNELMMSEKSFVQEMHETFKHFNGKTLVLDGQGPYIDREGKVHLPWDENGRELTLNTVFLNVAVQAKTANTGVQWTVNLINLHRIKKANLIPEGSDLRQRFEELRDILVDQDTSANRFDLNVRLMRLANDLGWAVGLNCFSGKDRTGYQMIELADALMKDKADEVIPHPIDRDRAFNRMRRGYFAKDSPGRRVIYHNTKMDAMKVTKWSLLGMSIDKRLREYYKAQFQSV